MIVIKVKAAAILFSKTCYVTPFLDNLWIYDSEFKRFDPIELFTIHQSNSLEITIHSAISFAIVSDNNKCIIKGKLQHTLSNTIITTKQIMATPKL